MSTINPTSPIVSDDLAAIAAEQRRELVAAKSLDADLDFAYNLQLQEAITASLGLDHHQPSSSSAAVTHPILDEGIPNFTDLLSDELLSLEQEIKDQAVSVSEFEKLKDDLHRRIHDHQVAMEIARIPEDEWENWGDDFERPFGEGSSKGVNSEIFRVYFKGLLENDVPKGRPVGGIGVAICDSSDGLLFQLRKQLMASETSRPCAEMLALVEGLTAALELDLKRVEFYCDYYPIFQYVTGKWSAKHRRKVSALLTQISHLQEKFTYCQPLYVPRNDIKFAFKLAREAAISAVSNAAESSGSRDSQETCIICLEDTNSHQMFSVDNCMHRYCFACMKQHVEVKLLHGMLPICPHEKCQTALKVDSCRKFLTPRLMEIMSHRIKEASIPVDDIIYCPYPKCSALMSKIEVLEYSKASVVGAERLGARKCMKCNNLFCINCKVPWHNNMTCNHYKWRYPNTHIEEARLKNLATANLWRQCVKCNHMIELAAGCYHMTCRCGYEFCYTCGAEWKNKEATCSCPLWDENYIIEDEDDFLFDENEFDEYEEEDEDEEEEY